MSDDLMARARRAFIANGGVLPVDLAMELTLHGMDADDVVEAFTNENVLDTEE